MIIMTGITFISFLIDFVTGQDGAIGLSNLNIKYISVQNSLTKYNRASQNTVDKNKSIK